MNLADLFRKDRKLFDSKKVEKEVINEDMGGLNAIDPKFREMFFTGYRYQGKKSPNISSKEVGQNSPIEVTSITKLKDISNLLFGEDAAKSDVQGMVLTANGNQILALAKIKRKDYKNPMEFKTTLDIAGYLKIEKDEDRKKKVAKVMYGYDSDFTNKIKEQATRNLSPSSAKYVVNALYKAAIESGATEINALVIKTDTARLAKQKERSTSKVGAVAIQQRDIKFKDDARRALRNRLEQFKANRAEQYKTPEEFMAAAMQKGYMEKVNIDGFPYRLDTDELRVGDILKPSNWTRRNVIKYKMDSSHSEKLDALKKQLWDLYDAAKTNPEVQAKVDELKAKMPPREISVVMSMQGGMIVPTAVEVSKEKEYW